jgi:hypothetical protein
MLSPFLAQQVLTPGTASVAELWGACGALSWIWSLWIGLPVIV